MRPSRMLSKWVKITPWYYAERNSPSRQEELKAALEAEAAADEDFSESDDK
jgi:hypothetical protein